MNLSPNTSFPIPVNGRAGLLFWKQDALAGIMVACVALPLSLAVATASGVPAVAGLLAAIVTGLVLPFLSGAYLTVGGPAAGLAPAIFLAVSLLGQGDMQSGYALLLPIIMACGVAQLLISRFKNVSSLNKLIPPMVITGVLASVGILVLIKQIPQLLGYTTQAHGVFALLAELPLQVSKAPIPVLSLGLGTLFCVTAFHFLSQRFKMMFLAQG